MKYLIIAILVMITSPAFAKRYATVNFNDNETNPLATLPIGAWWKGTVISTGDFGSGTLKLSLSADSACSTTYSIHDITGVEYSVTSADTVNVENGTSKTAATYLCGTLSGATAPNMNVFVYDYQ